MKTQTLLAAGLFVGTAACAHSMPQPEVMASTEGPVRAAEEAGAEKVPKAALYLKLAREQMVDAQKLAKEGDNKRANLVFARARADAELALALAQEKTTEDQVKTLRDEGASNEKL